MKKTVQLLIVITILTGLKSFAQVSIGSIDPDASAMLDVVSTTKGFLAPRHTTINRDAIVTPARGLIIFNTTTNQLEINTGTTSAPIWSAVGKTYTAGTSMVLSGTEFQRAALTGDVTANANTNATTITSGAVTTSKLADNAVTNAKIGEVISIKNGGTGTDMTTTSGYVKQASLGANFTTTTNIPVADVAGAVRKVNGSTPDTNGNVTVAYGTVFTGAVANRSTLVSSPNNGDIYVVSSDPTASNNGITYIYDGSAWQEVTANQASLDARYLKLAGGTMQGNLTIPSGTNLTIADAPSNATSAANKAYVDAQITAATPDATTLIKGKIKLAGDLSGTADLPTVPGLATKQNALTLTTTGSGAATLTGATLNIPTPPGGTVTNVSALTVGTSGTDIASTVTNPTTTPVIALNVPTASATNRGALSTADWTTFNNKIGGTGTTNYLPKFTSSKVLGNSSIFDNGTNVGIGTALPGNKLEITQGTSGNSGLRFTNLNNSNTALSANSVNQKFLSVNSVGDVVLVNSSDQLISVTGLASSLTSPVAAATFQLGTFENNYSKVDSNVIYTNQSDGTQWTYSTSNGGEYKSYNAPASTEWYNAKSTIDAGSNKTSAIWRSGNVGLGINSPYFQFGNTNLNTLGSDAIGTSSGAISWVNNNIGYAASFFNTGTSSNFNGLAIKIAGNSASNNALNVSQGTAQGTAGKNLLSVLGNGNVGIGTNSPTTNLHINNSTLATNTINAAATVLRMSRPQNISVKWDNIAQFNLGSYSTSSNATSRLDLAMTNGGDNTTLSNVMTWQANGNVGIGTTTPTSKFQVSGSSTNTTSLNAGSSTAIDFSQSNLAYTTASAGAITLNNVKDGGTYTLALQGASQTSGTAAFSATGFTVKYNNSSATTAAKDTVYTFLVIGTTIYVYQSNGM